MKHRRVPVPIRLLSYTWAHKSRVLMALVSLTGLTAFQLLGPQLVEYAIDHGIDFNETTGLAQGSRNTLLIAAGLITAAAAARGIFQFWQSYIGEWVSQRVAYDIRNDIYNHLQRMSFAYHDKAQTGQIMQRATQDVEGVRMFVNMGFIRLMYVIALLTARSS